VLRPAPRLGEGEGPAATDHGFAVRRRLIAGVMLNRLLEEHFRMA